MSEPLELSCFEIASDTMRLSEDEARDTPIIYLRVDNGVSDVCSLSLDAEHARQLFNWLGVWLASPK